jgi:predicted porin
MQKKIIALAVAGLVSGAAFAQSNVTIYGVMDLGQAFVKSSDSDNNSNVDQKTVGRLDSNASYIGFKGTEALGNGLTALFQFETSITGDTGFWSSTALTGRDTYIGLTGGFGTAVAGNLTHPLRAMGGKVEITPAGAGFGTGTSITGEFGGYKTGADDRAANAIAYVSPNFSGFTATVAYVNGEATESSSQNGGIGYNAKAWQIAGQYENGPLYAGIGYHKATAVSIAAAPGAPLVALAFPATADFDGRIWRLVGTYTLPTETKLMALYDNTHLDGPAAGDSMKRTAWSVGVAQPIGAHTVGLQYAKAGDINVTGPDDNDGAKMWTLAYSYSLSKRTLIHARYSKLNNDNDGASTFYTNPVANPNGVAGIGTGGDIDYTGYMVGLRHTF